MERLQLKLDLDKLDEETLERLEEIIHEIEDSVSLIHYKYFEEIKPVREIFEEEKEEMINEAIEEIFEFITEKMRKAEFERIVEEFKEKGVPRLCLKP